MSTRGRTRSLGCIGCSLVASVVGAAAAPCPDGFVEAGVYGASPLARGNVLADFDRDGVLDLAVGVYGGGVQVRYGTGDGRFGPASMWTTVAGDHPRSLAGGDLDGDGDADLVTAGEALFVLLSKGDGTFEPAVPYALPVFPQWVALGDLDGSGTADVVLGGYEGAGVMLANRDGTLQGLQPTEPLSVTSCVLPADMDGDGILDLVASNPFNDDVVFMRGHGDGTFGRPVHNWSGGLGSWHLATGDFDGDGHLDVTLSDGRNIAVLLGTGDGRLASRRAFPSRQARALVVLDRDGDGIDDILAAGEDGLVTHLGRGDGTFEVGGSHADGLYGSDLSTGDLDGNGILDVAVTQGYTDTVAILLADGQGELGGAAHYPSPDASDVAALDADSDGDVDLVTTGITVLINAGDGTFVARAEPVGQDYPTSIVAADWDRDGNGDVAVAGYGPLLLSFGIGDGTFGPPVPVPGIPGPAHLGTADLDVDGDADIVAKCADCIAVLLGDGSGGFAPPLLMDDAFANAPRIGDLDGDGIPDLVLGRASTRELLLLFGIGDGTFHGGTLLPLTGFPYHHKLGHVDDDAAIDLVVGVRQTVGYGIELHLGNGDGTFRPPLHQPVGGRPLGSALADFDLDGHADVAVGVAPTVVTIFHGNGDGTFRDATSHELGFAATRLLAEDLNLDGAPDLAADSGDGVGVLLTRALRLRPRSIPAGAAGAPYDVPLAADGGSAPYAYALADGALPPGVALSPAGRLSGTPVAAGSHSLTVEVTDASGCTGRRSYRLDVRTSAAFVAGQGCGAPNPNRVRVHDTLGLPGGVDFHAYAAGSYGVVVATGAIGGDPEDALLTGPGPGPQLGPHVRAFDARGAAMAKVAFYAYGTLKHGVNVAAADADADGLDEIVTGAGAGEVFGPHVRGFDYDGVALRTIPRFSFFAYGTLRQGANVAGADVDGGWEAETLTGVGPGPVFAPQVRAFGLHGGSMVPVPGLDFVAFAGAGYGVNVAAADTGGDGDDEVLAATGPGPTLPARFAGFDLVGSQTAPIKGFQVERSATHYGGRVGGGDVGGDEREEILTGVGPDASSSAEVLSFSHDAGTLVPLLNGHTPFPGSYGVNPASGALVAR